MRQRLLAAALLLPLVYLADASLTLAARAARGERVWEAHRGHYYQRATVNGLTVPGVVIGLSIYVLIVEAEIATEAPLIGSDLVLVLAHLLITTPWVVRLCVANLIGLDRCHEARELIERLIGICNDLGLIAEEYDVTAKRLVGNFPQAFSHVTLVNTILNYSRAHGPARERSEKSALARATSPNRGGGADLQDAAAQRS